MKKLITKGRWKDYLRRRDQNELTRRLRTKSRPIPEWRRKVRRRTEVIRVPSVFSVIKNPEEANQFFLRLTVYGAVANLSLDMQEVTVITPEAIAALIATISSLNGVKIRGNLPENVAARDTLLCSGFFEHARSTVPLPSGHLGKIKERRSKRVEPQTALELIDRGTVQAFGEKKRSHSTRATYKTLIELMGNTHNHAAGKKPEIETWWATAYGNSLRKIVCYTFVDTGVGIFRSVRVSLVKRAFRRIGVTKNFELLQEILQGNVESRTGLAYRGKGLPAIYQKAKSGDLKSLCIVTNNVFADVSQNLFFELNTSFRGTLYYWECEE